ncbi:acetyltransferase (GNAT) family protein [Sediminihabitans luteus]|uniref:Acetyltransferase (GNAT) family protein n=1 Tax=Sediminihabitans luteus TaxID=1138585 RepID=A0A2M9CQJ3_9CELL|nr:GNAT family N-acetyltransferase [Sediminihabitans luteus]PJJ74174.1 acetyltransferase (GNAT) family protein [Sediminihabitans luteus]GII99027.1 hypothetical protein Slu03_14050 [Sediminihabitans luteus]
MTPGATPGTASRTTRGAGPLDGLAPRWRAHPWVRVEAPARQVVAAASSPAAAVLLVAADDRGVPGAAPYLWALGDPDAAHALLARESTRGGILTDGAAPLVLGGGCVPRGTPALTTPGAPALLRRAATSDWDWFWTSIDPRPPRGAGAGGTVRELRGARDLAAASAAQAVGNPRAELAPTTDGTRWWGWCDDGGTVRCVVGARVRPAGWELGGIGTDPAVRGRGAATATLAAAVREGLRHAEDVVLGMYADNVAGRALYEGAGFVVGQRFAGWRTAT